MANARLISVPAPIKDGGLLVARVLLGVIFMAHGWQKLSTNGLGATAQGFEEMGVPLPGLSATVAALVELGGGALLALGLLTPVAGLLAMLVMIGAWLFAHFGPTIFVAEQGWELVAALGLGAAVFALVGPGRFSLDALLVRRGRRRTA